MPKFNVSPFLTLKYPLQNQYTTRVCHMIGSLVIFLVKLSCFLFYYLIKRL